MNDAQWQTIESYVGYGSASAPIVFIGMEEGLSKGDNLEAELFLRSTYTPYMDLHESFGDGLNAFLKNPGRRPTWIGMSAIGLRYKGSSDISYASCRNYMLSELGRANRDSLLTELMPYPSANLNTWSYLDRFKDREKYADELESKRRDLLRDVVNAPARRLIVAYGKGYWDRYKTLFDDCRWSANDNFEYGTYLEAQVVLAPHFASRPFNGELGRKRLVDAVFEPNI